jgi:hypothetical protein
MSPDHTSNAAIVQPSNAAIVQPFNPPGVRPYNPTAEHAAVQPPRTTTEPDAPAVQPGRSTSTEVEPPAASNLGRSESPGGTAPARERAQHAARGHYTRHGRLPTATELMELAQVARGTAGTVLKDLRDDRPTLHLVNADTNEDTDQ